MKKSESSTNREALIRSLFENTNAMKRGMAGHWQQMHRDFPVSRSQLELLSAIRHSQPVSFKQLAQQLYLTPGAISQLAEGLEQHQLIERQIDENDRRIQCLTVSKQGAKVLLQVEQRRQELMELMIAGLTDEELAVWLRVQEKMLQHFQTEVTEQTKKENA